MTWLEEGAKAVVRLASTGLLLTGILFITYVIFGLMNNVVDLLTTPYEFLTLHDDPFFNLFAFLISLLICIMSGALIFLTLVTGYDHRQNEFIIISGSIAFGFGAGAVRFTVSNVIDIFIGLL